MPSSHGFRRTCGRSAASPRGFTLVELMVVIAILAIVTGFSLVALRSVRQGARVTACLSQMRSVQQAHVTYATDHRGLFADVGLPHGGLGFPEQSFITTLRPYFDDPAVLHSPLDESSHWATSQGGLGTPVPGTSNTLRVTSYGMNDWLSRSFSVAPDLGQPIADRLSRVPAPSSTVMTLFMAEEGEFAGSDHPHVYEWAIGPGGGALPPIQAATQVQTDAAGGKSKTWDARGNYGFVDGHVATHAFGDVYQTVELNRFDPAVAATFDARTGGG